MTPDALDRTLAALAERADGHVTADRVAAVRRRARRTTVTKVSFTAAVVVAVVIAVVSGGLPFTRKAQPADPPRPFLRVELTPAADIAAAMPPPTFGGFNAAMNVRVRGLVPQIVPPEGEGTPEGNDNLLGLLIDWGARQGNYGSNGIEGATCAPGSPLVPIEDDYVASTTYVHPGTYTATYTTKACPPVGEVKQTLTIEVKR